MPQCNHYASIIISDIKFDNKYQYFYYDDLANNSVIIKNKDILKQILDKYNIYIALYHKISKINFK